jgi:hypothetical protein
VIVIVIVFWLYRWKSCTAVLVDEYLAVAVTITIAIDDYYAQANDAYLDGGLRLISQLCFLFVAAGVSDEFMINVDFSLAY